MSGTETSTIEALFRAHYPWLCTRLGRQMSAADAHDIAAETFTQLLEAPNLTSIREPRALLTTIARRLLWRRWQRRARERQCLTQFQVVASDHTASPEDRAQHTQVLNRLDQSFRRLPDKVRSTFWLARIDGLTYPQIAAQLNISERSVSVYMTRSQALCDRLSANQPLNRPHNKRFA